MGRHDKLFGVWLAGAALLTGLTHGIWAGGAMLAGSMDPVEHVLVAVDWSVGTDEAATKRVLRQLEEKHANDTFTLITGQGRMSARRTDLKLDLGPAYGARRFDMVAWAAKKIDADQRYLVSDAGREETMRMAGWTLLEPGQVAP